MKASRENGETAAPSMRRRIRATSGPAPVLRKPVEKRYGAKSRYGLGPGETAYERRRRERREGSS